MPALGVSHINKPYKSRDAESRPYKRREADIGKNEAWLYFSATSRPLLDVALITIVFTTCIKLYRSFLLRYYPHKTLCFRKKIL